jgi:hypothetical protein
MLLVGNEASEDYLVHCMDDEKALSRRAAALVVADHRLNVR